MMKMNAFWLRVKTLIKEKGVTQDVAARAIGLSPNTFRSWMSRNMVPPLSYAYKLARYFGVNLEYLINGKVPRKASQINSKEVLILLKDLDKKLTEIRGHLR